MQFFKLHQKPIGEDNFEAWSKICEDMAKVGMLAFPVLIYGQHSLMFKIYNAILLLGTCYILLCLGKYFRKSKQKAKEQESGIN